MKFCFRSQVNACTALSIADGVGARVNSGLTVTAGGLVVQTGDVTLAGMSLQISSGNLLVSAPASDGTASVVDAKSSVATPNIIYGRVAAGETGGKAMHLLNDATTLFQVRAHPL
jgi:hypothetical protein